MIWKDSYRLGVDVIDEQHMALFEATDRLMDAIVSEADSQEFYKVIEFLKDYVVNHFQAEEAYMASIHYSGLEEHKKTHQAFTNTVLRYEKDLIDCDFAIQKVKDLAGILVTWLIYHVARDDQKYAHREQAAEQTSVRSEYIEVFADCAAEVMNATAEVKVNSLSAITGEQTEEEAHRDIWVNIRVIGDLQMCIKLCFSKELSFYLLKAMTFMEPVEIDEMVISASSEITNITCGHATAAISGGGKNCDITTPEASLEAQDITGMQGIRLETTAGNLEIFALESE